MSPTDQMLMFSMSEDMRRLTADTSGGEPMSWQALLCCLAIVAVVGGLCLYLQDLYYGRL